MVKRTKIKSKDDVSWIKPETIKVKKIAAKCAQKKGNTSKLIKIHEEKIINDAKSEVDEMKQIKIKVKITPIKTKIFQKMHNLSVDPGETTYDMELVIDEDIKLEEARSLIGPETVLWPEGDPRWSDDTVNPANTISSEIEEAEKKGDVENRLIELRNARLQVCTLKEEISDRADDEELKEALEDSKYHTGSKFDSPEEEKEAENSSESYNDSKVDYDFPTEVSSSQEESWDRKHCISENKEVEESDDMEDLNVVNIIQKQTKHTPPSKRVTRSSASPKSNSKEVNTRSSPTSGTRSTTASPKSPPVAGSVGRRRRSSPRSAKSSTTSSPGLRKLRKIIPTASPPNPELIIVKTSKRKKMDDYDHLEAMEEQISRNIDNLWELNRL